MNLKRIQSVLFVGLCASAFVGPAIAWDKVYLFHILMVLLSVAFLADKETFSSMKFFLKKNPLPSLIFSYSIASTFWAANLTDALTYNCYLLCGFFLVYSCFIYFKANEEKVLRYLSYLFVTHVAVSLLEVFTPIRWPISTYSRLNSWFGKTNINFESYFEDYPTSFFWHQNHCALATALCLPFLFRSGSKLKFPLIILSYLIIFYAGSKSVTIISFLYAVYEIFSTLITSKINLKKSLLAAGVAIAVFAIALFFASPMQKEELAKSYETIDGYAKPGMDFIDAKVTGRPFDFKAVHVNVRERYYLMSGAIDLYKKHPLIGIGAGSHLHQYVEAENGPVLLRSIHNYWLELYIVFGPFIFLIYAFWIFQLLRTKPVYREAILILIITAPVLSSAVYFLPHWLLLAMANTERH
jgi:hypothetical protein